MAQAVVLQAQRTPDRAQDPQWEMIDDLKRLAALPGAPEVSDIIMGGIRDLYKIQQASYARADDNMKRYLDVHGFDDETEQLKRLKAAYRATGKITSINS